MKKLEMYWPFIPTIVLLLVGVAGWFVLPDVIKLEFGGSLPKLLGLLAPLAVCNFGGSMAARKNSRWAGVVVMVIAYAMEFLVFSWNL